MSVSADGADRTAWIVLGKTGDGVVAVDLSADGVESSRTHLALSDLAAWTVERERVSSPRWVWNDTPRWYVALLGDGVRVARCHDLRLCHAILSASELVATADALRSSRNSSLGTGWDAPPADAAVEQTPALFDIDETSTASGPPTDIDEVLAEFERQRRAIGTSADPGRLRLLTAGESAGALVAAEMQAAGLPWDAQEHDRILVDALGSRPPSGGPPLKMAAAATRVRQALGEVNANLDSQPKLLRSLHRAGVLAQSTSRWELAEYQHPVIEPLLEYKKLARLQSANGWTWLAEWVADGRFRPVYIPGGVVTGRWASSGGGALQLPRQLRAAVRADPGWKLVVADVAQLEPRVLAAMSGDAALAAAARGRDLYSGIVDSGAVATRQEAKIAMLGAMYGATTGESGRLVPRLRRAYPRAMGLVDDAARVGEDGGTVSTWLGRSSPAPSEVWAAAQSQASTVEASGGDEARARRWARDRGRFTRNFVVQGTAAEWALVWLADLRARLAALAPVADTRGAARSGPVFAQHPHLSLFLHDEVIVHTPIEHADAVAQAVADAAATAGRVLFGDFPIDFRLDVHVADTAEKA